MHSRKVTKKWIIMNTEDSSEDAKDKEVSSSNA